MLSRTLPEDRAEARRFASALVTHAQSDSVWVADVLDDTMAEARRRGWDDIRLALLHALVVYSWKNTVRSTSELIDELEMEADRIGSSALIAIAMVDRIRYLRSINGHAPFELYAAASVRLKDDSGSPGDRFAGLINLALELDLVGLASTASSALAQAERVMDEMVDPARERDALANNQTHRLLRMAAARMMEGECSEAVRLYEQSGATRAGIGDLLPESWMARLDAHRRMVGALVHGEDVPGAEAAALAEKLHDIDADMGYMLFLVRPLHEQVPEPTPAELDRCEHCEVAWFLRVRSLRRAGVGGDRLVAALEGVNRAIVSRSARARSDLEAGVQAMVDAQLLARERGELAELVVTDPLTRLGNRRAWENALDRLTGQVVTIVLADLDRFKGINDSHGHVVGDVVLQRFADAIGSAADRFRPDVVARIGGDEFGVVLAGDRGDDAAAFAAALDDAVSATSWPQALASRPSLTTGTGIGDAPDEAVARADSRLYDAKRLGRRATAAADQFN